MRLLHPLNADELIRGSIPVGIALGSNEGDRLTNLIEARTRITMLPQAIQRPVATCVSAPVYETAPVDCTPGAGWFLNTVLEIACDVPFFPLDFLVALRGIENSLGRPARHPRNVPRTIDLDILYAGGMRVDLPELTLPHPRLAQRRFVLTPLAEIRPCLVLPGETRAVSELLRSLDLEEEIMLYANRW